jgi:4-hydroxybenzoate polyprenyltransferase
MTEATDRRQDFGRPAGSMALRPALPAIVRLMRPHQWVKNAFVLAPLLLVPSSFTPDGVLRVLGGFVAFSLLASGVYVLNDLADREADRRHPVKCRRPIASGEVSPAAAVVLLTVLVGAGLGLAFALVPLFGVIAAGYFAMNVAYSFGLKHVSIVDVLIIATGFLLRVAAGVVLLDIAISVWALMSAGLVALFLALAKRRDDLVKDVGVRHRKCLEGYSKPFLDTAMTITLAVLVVCYISFTLDGEAAGVSGGPALLLTVPFVLAGLLRYLQICLVEERSGAPTRVVLTDRFLITAVVFWAVTFALLANR